jgi:hypothetical protein
MLNVLASPAVVPPENKQSSTPKAPRLTQALQVHLYELVAVPNVRFK